MLELLTQIERRAKYLDSVLPAGDPDRAVAFTLPDEPWANDFHGLGVPARAVRNIAERYGAEALTRSESPIVAMFRNAANGETPRLDAQIEIELMRLPDAGAALIEELLGAELDGDTVNLTERTDDELFSLERMAIAKQRHGNRD